MALTLGGEAADARRMAALKMAMQRRHDVMAAARRG
jgi:hypothetical protein